MATNNLIAWFEDQIWADIKNLEVTTLKYEESSSILENFGAVSIEEVLEAWETAFQNTEEARTNIRETSYRTIFLTQIPVILEVEENPFESAHKECSIRVFNRPEQEEQHPDGNLSEITSISCSGNEPDIRYTLLDFTSKKAMRKYQLDRNHYLVPATAHLVNRKYRGSRKKLIRKGLVFQKEFVIWSE